MPRTKKSTPDAPVKAGPVKYEAIQDFTDLKDGGKVYFVGDRYPNPTNKKIPEERLEQLLSKNNTRKSAVIKEI
ncbi:hypothetical protein ACRC6Q_16780 [Planococcus sp. SE5232]|uniref:hypothetical protein n=1 Tax=unclassified Planococcus (in: firmicutes) TaxID=2662419 RepID=UPI003D6B07C9